MAGRPSPLKIQLTGAERSTLDAIVRRRSERADKVERAQIVLRCAGGESLSSISRELNIDRMTVRKWIERFRLKRLDGLEDLPRSGRPPVFSPGGSAARRKDRVRAP